MEGMAVNKSQLKIVISQETHLQAQVMERRLRDPGDTRRKIGWGCTAHHPKSNPIYDLTKNLIPYL